MENASRIFVCHKCNEHIIARSEKEFKFISDFLFLFLRPQTLNPVATFFRLHDFPLLTADSGIYHLYTRMTADDFNYASLRGHFALEFSKDRQSGKSNTAEWKIAKLVVACGTADNMWFSVERTVTRNDDVSGNDDFCWPVSSRCTYFLCELFHNLRMEKNNETAKFRSINPTPTQLQHGVLSHVYMRWYLSGCNHTCSSPETDT